MMVDMLETQPDPLLNPTQSPTNLAVMTEKESSPPDENLVQMVSLFMSCPQCSPTKYRSVSCMTNEY